LIFFTFCFFFFSLLTVVNMFIKKEWGELFSNARLTSYHLY
jgi:hypothetical protein